MKGVIRRLAAACVLVSAAGCGGKVSIDGKVTLDGQPLESGVITFVPDDPMKGHGAGASIVGGAYHVEGDSPPPAGAYRVEIKAQRKTGRKIPGGSPLPPGTMVDELVEAIPARYNAKTTLRADLKPGSNDLNFELTSGDK